MVGILYLLKKNNNDFLIWYPWIDFLKNNEKIPLGFKIGDKHGAFIFPHFKSTAFIKFNLSIIGNYCFSCQDPHILPALI